MRNPSSKSPTQRSERLMFLSVNYKPSYKIVKHQNEKILDCYLKVGDSSRYHQPTQNFLILFLRRSSDVDNHANQDLGG